MKLGMVSLWGEDLNLFRARLREAESLGYDLFGVGDVPPGYHDPYISLALVAQDIKRGLIGPMVTSPALRNPVANVTAMSALYDLTGGRAVLGLGAGNSIAYGLGKPQPKQEYIREYILALRALFAGKSVEWDGGTIKPIRQARKVPVYYSALGPKARRVAGSAADGVILQIGQSIEEVRESIAAVRAAAVDAGRDPAEVSIWVRSVVSIGVSREEALRAISSYLAVNAPVLAFRAEAMARVPEHLRSAVLELQRRYDFGDHALAGGKNGTLAEELGLLEFLAGFKVIAGTFEDVGAYLRELEAAGVSLLMCSIGGQSDADRAMRDLIACAKNVGLH